MNIFKRSSTPDNSREIQELNTAIRQRDDSLDLLYERIAELEFGLEDIGWQKLVAESSAELSRESLRKINLMARTFWLKNPLVKRAVYTQTMYVFGQGVSIQAKHPTVNSVIQGFLSDPKNQAELTSHQARMIKETELQVFSNLFFIFFVDPSRGTVRVRTIPVDEIDDIICNPEDGKDPWYYRRTWTARSISISTGQVLAATRTAYYPDWRYNPTGGHPKQIGSHPVLLHPIYHIAVNKLSDMKFGVSEIYAALDWARAYKEFLENWATIVKSYSRYAWSLTTKGGTQGVQAAKTKLKTTLNTVGNTETNPPPLTGSTFISNESVKMEPMRTAGAQTSADDGRHLRLMVSSATGIFEHYLTGDPSTGNLATAKSMERPMELMFRDRQQLWKDVLNDIFQYIVDQAAKAPNGKLQGAVVINDFEEEEVVLGIDPETGEPMDRSIDILFPDLLEHDVESRINAVLKAATLDGKPLANTIDLPTVTRLLLQALGIEDINSLMKQLFPDGEVTAEGQPAFSRADLSPAAPAVEPEEMFVAALRELREAVSRLAGTPAS